MIRDRNTVADVNDEPVLVHTAAAVIDAEVIVAALRAHDIRAFIAGTGAEVWTEAGGIGQATRVPGPLNSIRIMVHPEDEERAREVLAAADQSASDDEASVAETAEPLPPTRWSLDETKRKRVVRIVAIVVLVPILYGIVVGLIEVLRFV